MALGLKGAAECTMEQEKENFRSRSGHLWQLKEGIEEEDVLVELGGMHGVHLFTCVGACTFMQMFISTPRVFVPDACV